MGSEASAHGWIYCYRLVVTQNYIMEGIFEGKNTPSFSGNKNLRQTFGGKYILSGEFIMRYCVQLHPISIDNSDVNPPEKLFSDVGTLPGKASRAIDSENCCFQL